MKIASNPRPLTSFLARLIWLSVLPPVLVAAWMATHHVLTQQEETRQQATNTVKNFAIAMDAFLDARIRALHILAVSPAGDDPHRLMEMYSEAQGFFASFGSHLILTDPGDPTRMLFNTRLPLDAKLPVVPQPQGHAAVATALATGQPAVGDIFMGPITKVPMVAIAVPAVRDGTVRHLLLTILETRQLQQRLDQEALPANWSMSLKDGTGDTIAHRATVDFDPALEVDDNGRFEAQSSLSHWKVVLEIPRNALRGPLMAAASAMVLAIVMATAAGVLGGTLAGRRLSRQMSALTDSASPLRLDITEIVNARHLLDTAATNQRLNESRYKATFEHASIGIAQMSPDGQGMQANHAACAMFGYSQEEFRTITWQQVTPAEDMPASLEYVGRLLAGDMVSHTRERRFLTRDGNVFWANLGVTIIRKPDGSPDYFIAIIENIQARKAAEAALMDRDALLTDIGAMTKIGGWYFNPATGTGQWTSEVARIHDLPEDQPVGLMLGLSYYTEKHRPIIEAAVRAAIKEAIPYDLELEILSATGQRKWVRCLGHPEVANGQVVRVRGAIQDITERKNIVLALEKSAQQYRQLVEHANSAILQWAPDGTILFFNEYAQELFGWSAEEILGRHVDLLLPEQKAAGSDHSTLVDEIASHPERFRHNINENIRRDGSRLWMNWTNRVLVDDHGQIASFLSIGSDISEHKQLMEELKQRNEELERFNRLSVGRELQMIELKRQINELSQQLGRQPPFDLSFIEVAA